MDPWRQGSLEEALADEVDHADVDHGEVGQQEGGHRLQGAGSVSSEWMNTELRFGRYRLSAECYARDKSGKHSRIDLNLYRYQFGCIGCMRSAQK